VNSKRIDNFTIMQKELKYNFVLLNTTTSIDLFNFGSSTLLIDITQGEFNK